MTSPIGVVMAHMPIIMGHITVPKIHNAATTQDIAQANIMIFFTISGLSCAHLVIFSTTGTTLVNNCVSAGLKAHQIASDIFPICTCAFAICHSNVFRATSFVYFKFWANHSFIAFTLSISDQNSIMCFCASVNRIQDFSNTQNCPLSALAMVLAVSASCSQLAFTQNWFTARSARLLPNHRTALFDNQKVDNWASPIFILSPSSTPFLSSSSARSEVAFSCCFVAFDTLSTACSSCNCAFSACQKSWTDFITTADIAKNDAVHTFAKVSNVFLFFSIADFILSLSLAKSLSAFCAQVESHSITYFVVVVSAIIM